MKFISYFAGFVVAWLVAVAVAGAEGESAINGDRRIVAREAMIDAELTDLRREWKSCYARAQRRSPWLRGKVVVRLSFGRDGRIAQAAVLSDSVRDRTATACVRETFRRSRRGIGEAQGSPVVVTMAVVAGVARAPARD
ncbi:MAG: AgmX/PglI C-terminal domain-containing protein [Deltaproteobacteria bacterium]|nr:AgmX/PglI C-terminal domain-containing protein [Deltaproteobacteria bacterium]